MDTDDLFLAATLSTPEEQAEIKGLLDRAILEGWDVLAFREAIPNRNPGRNFWWTVSPEEFSRVKQLRAILVASSTPIHKSPAPPSVETLRLRWDVLMWVRVNTFYLSPEGKTGQGEVFRRTAALLRWLEDPTSGPPDFPIFFAF